MSEIKLRKWQEAVLDWLGEYESYTGSETMQSLQQYDVNSLASISIKMPTRYGHTFFTSYLADIIPEDNSTDNTVVVVYFDMDHLKEIENYKKDIESSKKLKNSINNKNPIYISVYEFYYAINENSHSQNSSNLMKLKTKINGNVIVVDRASSLPNPVRDFILTVATNAIVFLG